jgi:hypothetical protein
MHERSVRRRIDRIRRDARQDLTVALGSVVRGSQRGSRFPGEAEGAVLVAPHGCARSKRQRRGVGISGGRSFQKCVVIGVADPVGRIRGLAAREPDRAKHGRFVDGPAHFFDNLPGE